MLNVNYALYKVYSNIYLYIITYHVFVYYSFLVVSLFTVYYFFKNGGIKSFIYFFIYFFNYFLCIVYTTPIVYFCLN